MKTAVVPFQDFGGEYSRGLKADLLAACDRVFSSGIYVLGPEVESFEREFAEMAGRRYAVGVASGLDALVIALKAMGIRPGDEVITTPVSAAATALAITHVGAVPVFIDVEEDTLTLNPAQLERAITSRTRAVLPVHLYGHPADIVSIADICRAHGIALIEDCAQAHLARTGGRVVGTFGAAACYSFYPTKNLGAVGDAGLIATDDLELSVQCRRYRDYGQASKYEHVMAGYNSRLDELQAAILRAKLSRLRGWTDRRRSLAGRYLDALRTSPIRLPVERPGAESAWHLFAIRTPERDSLARHLAESGIASAIHYPRILPEQPCYQAAETCRIVGDLAVARAAAAEVLSLPLFPGLDERQQDIVTNAVTSFMGG